MVLPLSETEKWRDENRTWNGEKCNLINYPKSVLLALSLNYINVDKESILPGHFNQNANAIRLWNHYNS